MLRLFRLLLFLSSVFSRSTQFVDKHRRASDVIIDLISRSGIENDVESQQFRQVIATHQSTNPLKLLHYLAPKIPAIRHSPDVALRIRASKTDMDCGLAACVIATLGRACELQDEYVDDILNDRRFEQLVECVMCGVDHKAEYTEGLSIRDACRAAWGIAVLTANRKNNDDNFGQVLQALGSRVARVLGHRQELLERGNMVQDGIETVQEGLELFSEELAEDAASVLWTFACVKACTGQNVTSLVSLCTSLLVQDPFATRKMAQEGSWSSIALDANLEIGANDAVERLAQSEMETESIAIESQTADHAVLAAEESSAPAAATPTASIISEKSHVLDWLSPNELIDSLWAIALHGAKLDHASSEVDACCEKALQKMAEFVQTELRRLESQYEIEEKVSTDVPDGTNDVDLEIGASDEIAEPTYVEDQQKLGDNVVAEWPESDLSNDKGNEYQDFYSDEDATDSANHQQLADELDDHENVPLKVIDAFELINTEKLQDEGIDGGVEQADERTPAIVGSLLDIVKNDKNGQEASTENENDSVVYLLESRLSPHDLCALAWAATELNGSHREVILRDISNIFELLGVDSVRGLSGADLSNSWAGGMAKFGGFGRSRRILVEELHRDSPS